MIAIAGYEQAISLMSRQHYALVIPAKPDHRHLSSTANVKRNCTKSNGYGKQ